MNKPQRPRNPQPSVTNRLTLPPFRNPALPGPLPRAPDPGSFIALSGLTAQSAGIPPNRNFAAFETLNQLGIDQTSRNQPLCGITHS